MSEIHYKFTLFQGILALALLPFPGAVTWAGEQPKLILQITVDEAWNAVRAMLNRD